MMKHSEEFKQEAVRIALTSGLPRERVAADLGVGKSMLGNDGPDLGAACRAGT
jgi:transposase